MLQNLNEHLCVSRYAGKEHDLWICYEPSTAHSSSKRQTWKRLTGLLSKPEMDRYLEQNDHCSEIKDNYAFISTQPQNH